VYRGRRKKKERVPSVIICLNSFGAQILVLLLEEKQKFEQKNRKITQIKSSLDLGVRAGVALTQHKRS
jgi:hypothetical protein